MVGKDRRGSERREKLVMVESVRLMTPREVTTMSGQLSVREA